MLNKKQVRLVILLCSVTYFICYLTRKNLGSIISVFENDAAMKMGVSVALSINAVTYGLGQLLSGYMGDRVKPAILVGAGLMTTALMNLILPFCNNVPLMVGVWGINGLAQAFVWPPMVRYLTCLMSDVEYSRACVRVSWGGYIGDIAVYLLSPICLALWHWKAIFFIAGGFGIAMVIVWSIMAPAYAKKGGKSLQKDSVEANSGKTIKMKWTVGLLVLVAFTMAAIALQGILRDGITTWMPTLMTEIFKWDEKKSILSGIILPLFSIGVLQVVSKIYIKWVRNEHLFAAIMFGIGTVAALLLYFVSGVNPAMSLALCTVISSCMHGVNYVLICMIPKHFEKYGKVSFMSGLLNACTYIGTAIAGYGMAWISESKGWTFTILTWSFVAGAGSLICILMMKKWGGFLKGLREKN